MRVYLDNCCYNRPFDEQGQVSVLLEPIAKLSIQQQMRDGDIEYAWSSVLDFEIRKSRFLDRSLQILPWANGATVQVMVDDGIRTRGRNSRRSA